ncbi:MAG: hypothetical protein V4616_14145, partial [Bacteroidota bacterium]
YYLYYGNKAVGAVDYPVVKSTPGATLSRMSIGDEEDLRKPLKSRSPLELSRMWWWALTGVVVVAAGGFTANRKKLRSKN